MFECIKKEKKRLIDECTIINLNLYVVKQNSQVENHALHS